MNGRAARGQTSLDFLMTYGWAVLLVVVVVASLFALGVFNAGSFLGPRATGFSQIGVIAWNVNAAGDLALRLQNFAGMDINVVNIEATHGVSHFSYDITNVSIPNSKTSDTFTVGTITGMVPGQYYTMPLRISYTDINGFNYTETGTISGTVGAGAVPPSIRINSPSSNSLLDNRTINISVSVWGGNLGYTDIMIIDSTGSPVNVTTNSQLGTYSVLLDAPTDGVYNITALANYTDGGSASATASNITVNTTTFLSCIPGLAAWWTGDGNSFDIFRRNDGTPNGGVSYASGEVGEAFKFDGSGGSIMVPDSGSLELTTEGTIDAWVKLDRIAGPQMVLLKGNFSVYGDTYSIYISGSGNPSLYLATESGQTVALSSPDALDFDSFHNIAGAWDGSTMSLYVDGVLKSTGGQPFDIPISANPLWIGSGTSAEQSYYFKGIIDEVQIYDRALNSSEISAIYNAAGAGICGLARSPSININSPSNDSVIRDMTININVAVFGSNLSYTNISVLNASGSVVNSTEDISAGVFTVQLSVPSDGTYNITAVAYYSDGSSIPTSNSNITVNTTVAGCASQPSGLVSWWPGDGDATDIIDTNNGAPNGSVTYAQGKIGQAFSLDGSDYIEVPDSASLNTLPNGFTIDAWIYPTQLGWFVITDKTGDWSYARFHIMLDGSGMHYGLGGPNPGSGSTWWFTPDGIIFQNRWSHVAWTYNNSDMDIYVNGAIVATNSYSHGVPDTSGVPFAIGQYSATPSSDGHFRGMIDEVQIYDRALNASEIQAIYDAGSAGICRPQISVTITAPLNDSIVGNLTFAVNFTASGAGLNLTNVTLINETGSIVAWNSSQSSGPVSITLTAPSNGTYTINATAYNDSASVASSIVNNVTINTAVGFACGVYVVSGNGPIYLIAPDGNVSQFMDPGTNSGFVAITSDSSGWLYSINYTGSVIRISSDGTFSQLANIHSYGNNWFKITADGSGNLYAIDRDNGGRIMRINSTSGAVSQFANLSNYSGSCWSGLTWDSGNLYAFTCSGPIIKITPDGSTSPFADLGGTYWSWHSATDGTSLYALDYNSHLVKITLDGTVIGLPSLAYIPWKENGYYSIAADSAGNIYALDASGPVTKITPDLTLSEVGDMDNGIGWSGIYRYETGVCRPPPTPLYVNITSPASDSALESPGTMEISVIAAGNYLNRTNISVYNSTGGLVDSTLNYSSGPIHALLGITPGYTYSITATAYDNSGNSVSSTVSNVTVNTMTAYPCGVYAVGGNGAMKIIASDGNMSQFANLGAGSGYQGITSDSSGRLYALSYTGVVMRMGSDGTFSQFANIGGNQFKITADDSGNLYAIDYDTGYVTKIAPDGTPSRLASLRSYAGNCWSGITWHSGYVYAATCNGPVIRIAPNGSTSQFATLGGTYWGWHIASDGAGNIHALDYSSNLKMVDPDGNVTVRPNLGSVPWKRNGYYAVAADSAGNVYALDEDGPVTEVFPNDTMIEYGDLGTGIGWPGIYRYEYPTCKTMYITTFGLANASVNNPYSKTLNLSGGIAPFTWSIVSGSLPDNVSLDSSVGVINGTPTTLGTYTFTVQVVDSAGANATQQLSLIVATCNPVEIEIQTMNNWNPPDECVDLKQYGFFSQNSYVCYYNDGCWAGMWGPSNDCWIGFGGNAIAFTYNTPCSQAQPGDFNDQNQGGCGQGSQTWGGCVAPNPTHTCIKDLSTGTMQDFDVAADGTLTLTSSCS